MLSIVEFKSIPYLTLGVNTQTLCEKLFCVSKPLSHNKISIDIIYS